MELKYKPDFSNASILVVGDVMLDSYIKGDTSRVSPEAPVAVVKASDSIYRIGGSGNVAVNCSALGSTVSLIGIVGKDESSTKLSELVSKTAIINRLSYIDKATTINKLRIISRHQQMLRIDFEEEFNSAAQKQVFDTYIKELNGCDVVILSDYLKGTLGDPSLFISAAKALSIPIIVDPKGDDFKKYSGATILTPNLNEFERVVGKVRSEKDMENKAKSLINDLNLDYLLVTRSEKGMSLYSRTSPAYNVSAIAKDVFDVTGAGDTVIATLGVSLAAKMKMSHAVSLSNMAASIVVSKLGTAAVTTDELYNLFGENVENVSSSDEIMSNYKEWFNVIRSNKQTIVMTNGCFDILHLGHVDYLNRAKQLGDKLVVAVNSDESVTRLKGSTRPVNSLSSRMGMLKALASVDLVLPFDEDTPEKLYKELLPDVLVKGGDYAVSDIVGANYIEKNGGKVVILDYVDGFSTTSLINKIQDPN